MAQKQDPTISRIREARHRLSEKFGHDPAKMVAYYLQLQEEEERRRVKTHEKGASVRKQGEGSTTA